MAGRLPEALLDYQLDTQLGENRRYITHIVQDADQPPSTPPRIETWKTAKRPVGTGGQGQVFLQKCVAGARHYHARAVKIVPCFGDAGKKRYLRELDAMVRFSHEKYAKHFVRMLGWYYFENDLCIAMEYIPGGDLQTYLREQPQLTEAETQQIISQVVQGLDIMHKGGFAHRDIKPQNVLIQQHPVPNISNDWWVKLADFGISKRTDAAMTVAGSLVGTLEFMPPEVIEQSGDESNVDYRAADMWAVGVMAFYILTRQHGFRRRRQSFDDVEVMRQVIAPDCEISSNGIDFILKMTSLSPRDRPTSNLIASHVWVDHYIPKLSIPPRISVTDDSSAPSSPDSLFSTEREMTTLATNLADTYLDTQSTTVSRETAESKPVPPPLPARPRLSSMTMPSEEPRSVDTEDVPGMSMLTAASLGRVAVVKRLISEGVSLDEQNTAFVEAASKGNATIVKLFCKARSDLTAKNLIVWTALEAAITRGHGEVVSVLAEQQLDFTTLHPSGSTYLQLAVTSGHAEVVRALSNNGVALNQLMDNGFTPIYSAAHDGHVKVVEVLADKVPGFLTPLRAGWGPLHIAALNGHVEVVRFLISRGADFTSATEDGWFPIDMAISNQSTGVVSFLFNCGAVPSEVTANGSTPLFIAAEGGNLELTRLLVAHGAKVDATNARGWTALNVACARGHFEVVKYLVGVGAEFSAASLEGWTPLNSAASEGFLEITKFLADKGADIHRQNADGWTPLLSAALGGYVEIVSFLAERGADPLAQTTAGVTPMAGAGARGHTEVVKLLNDLQSRVWMKTFSPLVAHCDTTPYRPLPPNILNHASWTSRTSYIGDRSAPKLFAYSQYLGVTGSGTGRFSFVLHNGPTNKHSALAAGGEIANGSQRKSLDSVIHVAAQPGSLETQQGVVTNIIMRAGIVGDGEMTVFRYTIKPTLRLGNDNAPHLAQVDFEWRRMPRNPADKQSYHKEMYLYQIQGQDKVGQNAIAPNVETERHPIAAPWAKFDITSRFETSNSFNFHFLRAMDNRTAIIALATAIQIWYMGTAGYINTGKIKGLLGYGKKETETPAST